MPESERQPQSGPPDPISALAATAGQLREIFESLVAGGFTEWQACRIIGVYLAELARQT